MISACVQLVGMDNIHGSWVFDEIGRVIKLRAQK